MKNQKLKREYLKSLSSRAHEESASDAIIEKQRSSTRQETGSRKQNAERPLFAERQKGKLDEKHNY